MTKRIAITIGMTLALLWGLALAVNADELTDAVNQARAQHGLRPLQHDPALAALAAQNNRRGLGHHVFAGQPIARQNSAWGVHSASAVVDIWLWSPAHRAAILAWDVTSCGGAYNGVVWTCNFGTVSSSHQTQAVDVDGIKKSRTDPLCLPSTACPSVPCGTMYAEVQTSVQRCGRKGRCGFHLFRRAK